jgi:hypothetical protein
MHNFKVQTQRNTFFPVEGVSHDHGDDTVIVTKTFSGRIKVKVIQHGWMTTVDGGQAPFNKSGGQITSDAVIHPTAKDSSMV